MTSLARDGVMKTDRLIEILAAYGAAPNRWPPAERAAAQALLARIQTMGSPQERARLQAALGEAEGLDGLLAGFGEVPDDAMARLTAKVAFPPAQVKKRETHFSLLGLMGSLFKPAAAMGAVMAALGLFVGFSVDPAYSNGDGSDYTVSQSADGAFQTTPDGDLTP